LSTQNAFTSGALTISLVLALEGRRKGAVPLLLGVWQHIKKG